MSDIIPLTMQRYSSPIQKDVPEEYYLQGFVHSGN